MNQGPKIVFAIIAVVVLAGTLWYIQKNWEADQQTGSESQEPGSEVSQSERQKLEEAGLAARLVGDYEKAAELYEQAADASENKDAKYRSLSRAGISNFLTGELSSQYKGIEQLKQIISDPETEAATKAAAIGDLASIVCGSGCDDTMYELVFAEEPIASYAVDEDMGASIANLYEWSLELSPTSGSYVRLASWHAEQILNGENTGVVYAEHEAKINEYINEADQIVGSERLTDRAMVSYNFWKGYSYGALATVDEKTYGELFERAYRNAISEGSSYEAGSDVAESVAFAYYQYAALLHEIYGNERFADIEANITALAELIRADERPSNNQFLLMVKNEQKEDGYQHGFIGQSVDTLAANYQEFDLFLGQFALSPNQ